MLSFEEFKNINSENENEARKVLADFWKTNKLIAFVKYSRENGNGNKYAIVMPVNLYSDNIYSPFNGKIINECYVNLNKLKDQDVNERWIIFDFNVNYQDKLTEDNLIRGGYGYVDIFTNYERILDEIGVNLELFDTLLSEKEKNDNKIPLDMYKLFKNIDSTLIEKISSNSEQFNNLTKEIERLDKRLELKEKLVDEAFKQEREKRQGELDKEIKEYRKKFKKEERDNINVQIKLKRKKLEEIEEDIATAEDRMLRYKLLGIHIDNNENKSISGRRDIVNQDLQIDYIQKYLEVKEGLYYSKDIIKRFYIALKTKQIIILSGPPGTGKTSLVNYLAKAVGANSKIIPVQTNWSDNQDLLGFYNPVEKYYFSTPFLDALVEARENPKKLYFICLDEMNLARIEYYFSEFLSVLEKNKDSEKVLNLYSKFIYEDLQKKIDKISEHKKSEDQLDYEEKTLVNQFKALVKYPAEFVISKNVRFIGTLNADETTMELSPKVIDRSFIIEILEDEDENEDNKYSDDQIQDNLYIVPEEFELDDVKAIDENSFESLYEIKQEVSKINIKLTKRFDKQLKEILAAYDYKPDNKFYDYVISSKILPKINVTYEYETDDNYNALLELKSKIKEYLISYKKLSKMMDKAHESKIITYWI